MASPASVQIITFGEFEVKLGTRELCREGARVRLPDQSFQILAMLLERPGELITREEIHKRLWRGDTFVDFDHGLNNAMNRLREALGDSAESHVFIETLPRRGYRFVGIVEAHPAQASPSRAEVDDKPGPTPVRPPGRETGKAWLLWISVVTVAVLGPLTAWRLLAPRPTPSAPIRSLAVLPLENLSGDSAQDYFADGMTEALITNLARIGALRVISRTSMMGYKNTHKSIGQIAQELNIDAVIEGSVVRSGNRVRINAQLIQAKPERHLWANEYERDATDVVALQGDVARAIADEIQVQLTPQEQAHLARSRLVDPDAYNAYLLGRYFMDRADKDSLERALGYYQQAIQLDPNYAAAWAGLADAHRYLGGGGYVSAHPAEQSSRAAVERAIQLDPNLADAHAALGAIQLFDDFDVSAARVSYQRALSLEPGNVSALQGISYLDTLIGQFDEALVFAREAVARDPLNPRSHRLAGRAARLGERWADAQAALDKAVQLNPQGPLIHAEIGCVYLAQSRAQQALAEMEQEKGPAYRLYGLAMAYHALGRKGASDAAISELIKLYGSTAAYQVAEAYGFRGDNERAFTWLERAYIQRDGALVNVKTDPLLTSLHSDPRFAALLEKMHLPG